MRIVGLLLRQGLVGILYLVGRLYSATPLGDQVPGTSTIIWYPTHSHYRDTDTTSPCHIVIMTSRMQAGVGRAESTHQCVICTLHGLRSSWYHIALLKTRLYLVTPSPHSQGRLNIVQQTTRIASIAIHDEIGAIWCSSTHDPLGAWRVVSNPIIAQLTGHAGN